jgi:hypothetical protein
VVKAEKRYHDLLAMPALLTNGANLRGLDCGFLELESSRYNIQAQTKVKIEVEIECDVKSSK